MRIIRYRNCRELITFTTKFPGAEYMSNAEYNELNQLLQNEYHNENLSLNRPEYKSLSIVEGKSTTHFDKWVSYIEKHNDSTIYSHPLWLKALEDEYNKESIVLFCEDENYEIRGVLPLLPTSGLPFKKNEPVTAKRLASLPRTPISGLLYDNDQVLRLLLEEASSKATDEYNSLLQIKSYCPSLNAGLDDIQKVSWRESYFFELPECPTQLRFGNKKQNHNIRWGVTKAKNSGLAVREADSEKDLQNWYNLYLETMRWHVVPARPYRFFKYLWENLKPRGLMRMLVSECVEENNKSMVAGSMFLNFNKTVFYAFNGRNASALALHANDLIQWEAIHKACEERYLFYDMGEVSEGNGGLAHFKAKWGCGTKMVYHYYNDSTSKDIDKVQVLDSYKKIWQKLPLGLTKSIGGFINRYL